LLLRAITVSVSVQLVRCQYQAGRTKHFSSNNFNNFTWDPTDRAYTQ